MTLSSLCKENGEEESVCARDLIFPKPIKEENCPWHLICLFFQHGRERKGGQARERKMCEKGGKKLILMKIIREKESLVIVYGLGLLNSHSKVKIFKLRSPKNSK